MRFSCLLLFAALGGCAVPVRDAKMPPDSAGYVAVLSGEMPGAISQVARHAWIIVNVPGAHHRAYRYELGNSGDDPFDYFGTGDVAVHGIIHYPPDELGRVNQCLQRARHEYGQEHP